MSYLAIKKMLPHSCIPNIEKHRQQDEKARFFEKIFYGLSLHISVFSTGTQMPFTYTLSKPVSRVPFIVSLRKLIKQCVVIPIHMSLHTSKTLYVDRLCRGWIPTWERLSYKHPAKAKSINCLKGISAPKLCSKNRWHYAVQYILPLINSSTGLHGTLEVKITLLSLPKKALMSWENSNSACIIKCNTTPLLCMPYERIVTCSDTAF